MILNYLMTYLILVNIFTFCLICFDHWYYKYFDKHVKPKWLCGTFTVLGGALGSTFAYYVLKEKINKSNIKWRMQIMFYLLLQAVIVFLLYGPFQEQVFQVVSQFYKQHIILIWYLIVINIVTFILYGLDKAQAIIDKRRIPINSLLILALIGGTVGGLSAMKVFHHKVKKKYFSYGLPILLLAQIYLITYYAIHYA